MIDLTAERLLKAEALVAELERRLAGYQNRSDDRFADLYERLVTLTKDHGKTRNRVGQLEERNDLIREGKAKGPSDNGPRG